MEIRKSLQDCAQFLSGNDNITDERRDKLLDTIKKADQELAIQTALERVRARSLSMNNTSELQDIIQTVHQQFLNLEMDVTGGAFIVINADIDSEIVCWGAGGTADYVEKVHLPFMDMPIYKNIVEGIKKGPGSFQESFSPMEKEAFFKTLFKNPPYSDTTPERKKEVLSRPGGYTRSCVVSEYTSIFIVNHHGRAISEHENDILSRMGKVFEQAYIRFLDIQKAEAQAREARIEAALERVRAKTMAMHNSQDISATVATFFNELTGLGLEDSLVCGVNIYTQSEQAYVWAASGEHIHEQGILRGYLDMSGHPLLRYSMKIWQQGKTYGTYTLKGDAIREYYQYLNAAPDFSPQIDTEEIPEMLYHYSFSFSDGVLFSFTEVDLPEDIRKILERFASVFGQTYTRYLDLKKAEKRAREAEIEAALERVRARSMAMHKSEELSEVATVLFQQVEALGGMPERMNIGIIREEEKIIEFWSTQQGGQQIDRLFKASIEEPTTVSRVFKAWKRGDQTAVVDLTGNELKSWVHHMKEVIGLPVDQKLIGDRRVHSVAMFSQGLLLITTPEPVSEQTMELLQRFAAVFDQTYTRFLDLQKAEAQAREAEIEAALERVRAKTMAMHQSEEMLQVIQVIAEQLEHLNIKYNHVSLGPKMSDGDMKFWLAGYNMPEPLIMEVPFIDHPIPNRVREAQEKGEFFFADMYSQGENRSWSRHFLEHINQSIFTDKARDNLLNAPGFARSSFILKNINLYIGNYIPEAYTEEENAIVGKFAKVFEQAYTRFLDLQKAESQAREARIEAALERVRAKTMAMHNTEDIAETVTTFFNELLGLDPDTSMRCGVGILSQSEHMKLWTASIREGRKTVLDAGTLDMSRHSLTKGLKQSWSDQNRHYSYVLEGRDLEQYFRNLNDAPDYPATFNLDALPTEVYHNSFFFRDGVLYVFTEAPLQDDIRPILERFATVFGQTYTRYLDLQKAEERARVAITQASIERVRGEISSMRSAADLQRITPLIWNELTTLGVPFFRCGVFIVEEGERKIHSFLSNPKGESLAAWQVGFGVIPVFDDMVKSWQKQTVFLTEWDRQGFLDFSEQLIEHGLVDDRERYQSGKDAPEHLVLQMVPFAQGMLYVGSKSPLAPGQMELVEALAGAFSVAYARYDDFRQLEITLAELKATQAQLIQSEKMASLGELTAGIAHEIKNPLNFVNNFSEVSRELLEELMEELKKGDLDEVNALTGDLIQNLDKIVHHGQRADSIVRGMLQHSRSGDGKKEPTDLNLLADEYMRLAYHGLRARDKSFNATVESEFDDSIGKIEIIPQDIGRVLLNLLTNAFHAVGEKAKMAGEDYTPTVRVKTFRENGQISISVVDNGGGIPEKAREKIFQPFFTTKPTGEGTGLGLSMSYDIVTKGHGGKLEMQSEAGTGSTFTICLPQV